MNNRSKTLKSKRGCLIAILVSVTVIIPISLLLATVFLSDASPGKARPALALNMNAITSVREWQSSEGIDNFAGMTLEKLQMENPDLEWVDSNRNIDKNHLNRVSIYISNDTVIIATRDNQHKQKCYFSLLTSEPIFFDSMTHFATTETDTCSASLSPELNQKNWSNSIREGWV